jgi:hypothetical protein
LHHAPPPQYSVADLIGVLMDVRNKGLALAVAFPQSATFRNVPTLMAWQLDVGHKPTQASPNS